MNNRNKDKMNKEFDLTIYQHSSESCNGGSKKKGKKRKLKYEYEKDSYNKQVKTEN